MLTPAFKIMAAVNLTTDSFSDGGLYLKTDNAIKRIEELLKDGADFIDLGAESTRPGYKEVSIEEEWSRLSKVIDLLQQKNLPNLKLSIDTRKPEIARRVIESYEIKIINHVAEETFDDELLKQLVKKNIAYVCMHTSKKDYVSYSEGMNSKQALSSVENFFKSTHEKLLSLDFKPENIILDPGIGYAKDLGAQFMLMKKVKDYSKDYNILMGVSRKSWIGKFFGIKDPMNRDDISKITELMLTFLGAKIIRTHNVKPLAELRKLSN